MAWKMGSASPHAIGITGILRMVLASLTGSFLPPGVAPQPGVSGSPVWTGMSITLPRCTPNSGRYGPSG